MGEKLFNAKIGDVFNQKKIKSIGGQSEFVIVYVSTDNLIGWEVDEIDDEILNKVSSRLNLLSEMISIELPEETIFNLRHRLAVAAFSAFSSEQIEEALAYFNPIEEIIKRAKTPEESKIYYISCSILYSILFGMLLYVLSFLYINKEFFYCAIAGCLGALLSIISRGDQLSIKSLTKSIFIHLQVIIKVVLGLISGILFLLGAKANILLGSFSNDLYSILLFGTMAGFSERFIPDFMEKLEKFNYNSEQE